MSMPYQRKVKCPKCGSEVEFTVWQSINTMMPFAIPDIISGKLFEETCSNCGQVVHLNYPFLFNDMIHNVMIWYCSPDSIEQIEKSMQTSKQMCRCKTRIVTTQASLREKVAIFNAGLDDRVVELMKAALLIQAEDKLPDGEFKGAYYHPEEKPYVEVVIDDTVLQAFPDDEMYDRVLSMFPDVLAPDNDDESIIDREWAEGIIYGAVDEE